MSLKKNKSLYLKCDCSCHLLEIEYDDDFDDSFCIALWSRGRQGEILSWRDRIRWIWNIIRTGNPWSDSIIINKTKAKEIINYINKHL